MSAKSIRFMTVTASTSDEDLFRYLIAISSGITVPGLMEMVAKLPAGKNSNKLGHLAMGSCLNIRKIIDEVRTKAAVSLSDDWTVNGGMNFSCFALLGHLFMKLPEDAMTPMLKEGIESYKASLGGANSLDDFSQANVTEGKEVRGEILMKWKGQLKGVKMENYRSILAAKFPKLVLDNRNIIMRTIGSFINITTSPATFVYNLATGLLSIAYSFLYYSFYAIFLAAIFSVILNSGLAKTSYVIFNAGAEAPSTITNRGIMESALAGPSSSVMYSIPFSFRIASAALGGVVGSMVNAFTLANDMPGIYAKITSEDSESENPFLEVMEEYFGGISTETVSQALKDFVDSIMTITFSPLADEDFESYVSKVDTIYMINLGDAFKKDMESLPMIGDAVGEAMRKVINFVSETGIDTSWIKMPDVLMETGPEDISIMDTESDSSASEDRDASNGSDEETVSDVREDVEDLAI
jgi:hypothetical protein